MKEWIRTATFILSGNCFVTLFDLYRADFVVPAFSCVFNNQLILPTVWRITRSSSFISRSSLVFYIISLTLVLFVIFYLVVPLRGSSEVGRGHARRLRLVLVRWCVFVLCPGPGVHSISTRCWCGWEVPPCRSTLVVVVVVAFPVSWCVVATTSTTPLVLFSSPTLVRRKVPPRRWLYPSLIWT